MAMGRPRIEIDWKEFDKLCGLQCTLEEIAGWFNCTIDTIENRVKEVHGITFSEYFKQKRSGGKVSLRRKQYETAMSGNPTMLIWLGKQYLGQSDRQAHELSGPGGTPIRHETVEAFLGNQSVVAEVIETSARIDDKS